MILGIHQPQYLPWLGYLDKIKKSDKFVFLDDVQYKKREFQNRNRIRTPNGSMWLTVPVLVKGKYYQNINEVEINNDSSWRKDHLKAIEHNYGGSPYFENYYPGIEELLSREWNSLCDLNIATVKLFMEFFEINTPCELSSSLEVKTEKTQRLIDICKKTGCGEYLSGRGGKDYMEEDLFKKEGIKLHYQHFDHPEYRQNFEGFVSHLSALDYLFNCGKNQIFK